MRERFFQQSRDREGAVAQERKNRFLTVAALLVAALLVAALLGTALLGTALLGTALTGSEVLSAGSEHGVIAHVCVVRVAMGASGVCTHAHRAVSLGCVFAK